MNLHDHIDDKLGTHGANSIFQKVRFLNHKERRLFDECFRQAEEGKLDIRAAEKAARVAFRKVEGKIPDLRRRLELALEIAIHQITAGKVGM